jgi:hypothetical protein
LPNAHIRELGQFGVITDVDPYDLPTQAWSLGVNVRFKDKKVSRAPVFRDVKTSLAFTNPRGLSVASPSTGFDSLFIGYLNGRVTEFVSGAETDRSIAGYVNSDSDTPFTTCFAADVFYHNREDRVPWYKGPTDVGFHALGSGWDSSWRARILRAYKGALVALNVTMSGVSYPTRVLTSEFTTAGATPANWNFASPTSNATENDLSDMEGQITDACALRNTMCIYALKETWVMQLEPGSEEVYSYNRIFSDAGSLNANCSVEVDGKNYVFGLDDIWMHDGMSKASICDERTRKFIFGGMNVSKAHRFYVYHNKARKEIDFNYVSGDSITGFASTNAEGCNRKAVFDYVNNSWTFDDLPFVFGSAASNLDNVLTYASVTATYDTIGGTYLDQEDTLKKTTAMVGGLSSLDGLVAQLYAFDTQGPGSTVSYVVNTTATKGWQLQREGIDLDEVAADLNGYKTLSSLYPQGRLEADALPIEFTAGACDYANQTIIYKDWQTYDGQELYKLDFNVAGRFLAIKIRHNDYHWATLSGFDADIELTADR